MSANTGFMPEKSMELAEAIKVNGVVIISSPGFNPRARTAACSAVVPFDAVIVCLDLLYSENFSSNSFTFGPEARMPDLRTDSTDLISSSPIMGLAIFIIRHSTLKISVQCLLNSYQLRPTFKCATLYSKITG